MFKRTKTRVIGLALVGAVVLAGAVYTTTAVAVGGVSAYPTTAQAAQTATESQLRSAILDMLEDHMGITGSEANSFADQMVAHMQDVNANGDFDFEAMVDRCNRSLGSNPGGGGMMGGSYGGGMMGGSGLR